MGRLKIIKASPMSTIQDFGRFGFRQYGIPQSGTMDKEWMITANKLVGNAVDYPIIEFAIQGMTCEVLEESYVSVIGASFRVNGQEQKQPTVELRSGDRIDVSAPQHVYGYLAIAGRLEAKEDFGSISTYTMAQFGGIEGRTLKKGDELISEGRGETVSVNLPERSDQGNVDIRIMKGPEWDLLKELPDSKTFQVDPSSNRMGIRLIGSLACDFREIISSAVVPGTIQLPSDGNPIVLMNDCQTTGGYPRIGKVLDEDLGMLAQVRSGGKIRFVQS